MAPISRRKFATGGAALAAGAPASTLQSLDNAPPEFAVEDQTPFRGQTRRLKITDRGRFVTALLFPTDYPTHFRLKPELHPVLTPKGLPVTDSHPYCFIHHQAIMCGHGRVRSEDGAVTDFYRKLPFPQEDRADRWHSADRNLFHLGPSGIQRITGASWEGGERASIELTLAWETRERNAEDGIPILAEQRRYEISRRGPFTVVDHFSRLVPEKGTAVLEADRHSFCGVRTHDLIDVEDGGRMFDSEGRENPDGNYWDAEGDRRAPRWVDCTGRIGDGVVGVTLMGHPDNERNEVYVRHWGLMEVSATLGEDVSFSADRPFEFRARYAAHDGKLDVAATEDLYAEFGRSPSPAEG
ncbi:MAG: DUF6807 family protein [Verrucomicrobiales bacterium]